MSQALHLFRLQKVDTQIDRILARQKQIEEILRSNEELLRVQQAHNDAVQELKQAQSSLKEVELAVQSVSIKLELNEKSLYGGKVHNPKELQDLQHESSALKRHRSTLEDQQLEAMLRCEEIEAREKTASTQLQRIEAEVANQHQQLIAEREQLKQDLERHQAERQVVAGAVAAANLQKYDQLRQQRRGIAVTTVEDESCAACGAGLTPAERQAARSPSQVSYCPSCGRIIYAG